MVTGRERAWDIRINGIPFVVVEDANGEPLWSVEPIPRADDLSPSPADKERQWSTWHSGCGYAQFLYPNTYHYTLNMDASNMGQVIMGPMVTELSLTGTAPINGFFEQSSSLYCLAGKVCVNVVLSNSTTVISKYFATVNATAAANFDGKTLVMVGNATNSWQFDGTTWTQTNTNNIKGAYLAPLYINGTGYVLARSYPAVTSSDPAVSWLPQGSAFDSADWVGNYDVGDDGQVITGLAARERTLWVAKADGLYYVDASGRTPKVISVTPDTNNGVNLMVDSSGKVWYPSVGGFFRYDSQTGLTEDVSPGRGTANEWPMYGRVTAQAEYFRWHYIALYNANGSYILRGREREPGEPGIGSMVWHGALVYLGGGPIGAMHVTMLTTPPRLYFGYGTKAAWIPLPTNGDNPLQDSRYKYAESGHFYLPADNWGRPGGLWSLTGVTFDSENTSPTSHVRLWGNTDGTDWRLIRYILQPRRVNANVAATDSWVFGRCAFDTEVYNPSPSMTPIIRSIIPRAQNIAPVRDVINTTVYCSDEARSRYGIPTRLSGAELLQFLKGTRGKMPIPVDDWWTGSKRTRFAFLQPVRERLIRQQGDKAAEQVALVALAVLTDEGQYTPITTVPSTYGTAKYGEGRYGIGIGRALIPAQYGTARYGTDRYK